MLSYRHAFHAGNHADVLKHLVLVQVLGHLAQKDTPFWYLDTHAGAGGYALDSGYATKNAEHETGLGRLWQRSDLPAPVAEYVALVRSFNTDGALRFCPGSPRIAARLLRPQDRLRLFERHPADGEALVSAFAGDRRAQVQRTDGFAGLKALLPPPPRRAVILIDPSYEEKRDYARVVTALGEGLKRFATGVYLLWYPQLSRPEAQALPAQLRQLPASWLHAWLRVQAPSAEGFGMHGSGLFILNPPWRLREALAAALPFLAQALGQPGEGAWGLENPPA